MTAPDTVSYAALLEALMFSRVPHLPSEENEVVELICTLQLLQELVEESGAPLV